MATAITATVIAANPVPNVQLDVTVDTPATVTGWRIYRDQPAESAPLYIGTTSSGAMSVIDYTAPLGVPVTYRMVIERSDFTSQTVTSAAVTIVGTVGCFLTNPYTAQTIAVELQAWPERTRAPRRTLAEVLDRADPVALFDRHSTPAGAWTLISRSDADTETLVRLLTAAATVLLRTQPGSSIATVTVSVGEVNERRYSGAGGDQRRLVDVEIQEIAPLPATALPLPSTLGGLAVVDGDTLGSLSLFRPTLLQLSMVITGPGAVLREINV